jgi:hypothetical protein
MSGAGGGSGGGAVSMSPCGAPCPAGQVCDVAAGRCVRGAGWDSVDASVPAAMSGRRPVLRIDAESRAFIVHRGYVATDRLYLSRQTDAGGFEHGAAGFQGNVDWQNDVLDEPDGGRWIALSNFYPNNTKDVALLHVAGGDYAWETLPNADFGTPASLAEHGGDLYVLWARFGGTLAISRRIGDGGFTTRGVPVPMMPSWTAELRIDSSGAAHVAYGTAGMTGGVFYGSGPLDGGIVFEQVDGELSVSRVVMELEPSGTPQLAYWQLDGGLLHWARRSGAGWQREVVSAVGGEGWNPALALDSANRPHVSYFVLDGGMAQYAVRVAPNAWERAVIDVGPSTGAESDIALTPAGRPCVAYTVTTPTYYGLRYACLPTQ